MKYIIYLEQFTYLSFINNSLLLYNEKNNTILKYENIEDTIFLNIIKRLNSLKHTFTINISKSEYENIFVSDFIKKIRINFMGDCIITNHKNSIFSIKPTIEFKEIEYVKVDRNVLENSNLRQYLQEVTINTGNYTNESPYSFVFFTSTPNKVLRIYNVLEKLVDDINLFINIQVINIICYPNTELPELKDFILKLNPNFKIILHSDILIAKKVCDYIGNGVTYFIYSSLGNINNKWIKSNHDNYNIKLHIIINSYVDTLKIDEINFEGINYSLCPSLETKKLLEQFVYNSQEDILEQKLNIKQILTNKIINKSLWGRIYIDEDGLVSINKYSKDKFSLTNNTISDVIFNEMQNKKYWFLTRAKVIPCKNCVFCNLCSPISDYELFTEIYNMCNIWKI